MCTRTREISVEKMSLDDSPFKPDYKKDSDTNTPVRERDREMERERKNTLLIDLK